MARKHITRDYSAHRKSVVRPTQEYRKVEIFSYDHAETMYYSRYEGNTKGSNIKEANCLSWQCYESENGWQRFEIDCNYVATEFAEYRIDVIYQNKTDKDFTGFMQIFDKSENKIKDDEILFDGESNCIKRLTTFYELEKGEYKFSIRLPFNCYFMGAIIRKIKYFSGDNIDSAGTNLMFIGDSISNSSLIKPAEATVTIGFDDSFECELSDSGFYMDYRDEINIYTKDDDGEIKQLFGGYISSILPDADRTKLTVSCADRLIDGQNKYVMDSMYLLGGTKKEEEYDEELYHDFGSYGEALKYLCDICEVTLKNNINENYLVSGESYQTGLAVTYGTQGNAKNLHGTEMTISENATFTTVRNNAKADKKQTAYIYDVKDYSVDPVEITNFPNFYLTYGIGDPKRELNMEGSANGSDFGGILGGGSKSFIVCADNNGWGNEQWRINTVCDALRERGHQAESGGVDSNSIQSIGLTGRAKGKIGIFIVGGQDGGCFYDFAMSWYNYDYIIQVFASDTATTDKWITCNGLKSTNCYIDPRQGYDGSVYSSGVQNYTPYEWCKKYKNKTAYACGKLGCSWQDVIGNLLKLIGSGSSDSATPENVFKEISDEAFKYNYCLGCGSSSWSEMKSCGYGDCWAFSEFIFTRLKERGVSCKIVEYATSMASNHRTVMYKDANDNWVDFPYREYGWNTRYDNMLNNTSGSSSGAVISSFEGSGIDDAGTGVGEAKKMTVGYDKDKPFQFYIEFTFSNDKTHTHQYTLNATATSFDDWANGRINTYWINNVVKQATFNVKERMADIVGDEDEEFKYFIHQIKFEAPKNSEDWYTSNEDNIDESSCKMDLYGLGFNNGTIVNPTDLSSCGKSITSQMESLVKDSGYLVKIDYAQHRKDDTINFMVDNQIDPSYTAKEGNDNNILSWGSISYTPVSNLFNTSVYVYKKNTSNGQFYRFVNTKDSNSVLKYGEQITLQTTSDAITDREAYFNARKKSEKYNPVETYSYTITVPFSPDVDVGDLVKIVADAKKLNTLKRVQSVKYTYDISKIPKCQTTIGLGELDPDSKLKKTLREIRESAKKESTLFSTTAQPINNKNLYQWEN